MNKKLLSVTIASILATTIGCGGGGSSKGSSGTTPTSPATLSGKASKGVIQSGLVTAYELNASGTQVRSVGTATTGSDGSYSLTLDSTYAGGPIQLIISATSATTM